MTDWPYQQKLPFHARSTVSKSIKNNVKSTELNTDPNLKLNAHKAEVLIANHVDHRKLERDADPVRFNVRKTIAEKCVQRPVPDTRKSSSISGVNQLEQQQHQQSDRNLNTNNNNNSNNNIFNKNKTNSGVFILDNHEKSFKEIRVKQEFYDLAVN